jgi:rod shape determining protein RodA
VRKRSYFIFDYVLLFYIVALCILGILFSYSSNLRIGDDAPSHVPYIKQLMYFISGVLLMWVISMVNYKKIAEHSVIIFILCVGTLLYTLLFGKVVNNSKRWIDLGFTTLQASEFVKVAMIIVIANFLDKNRTHMKKISYIFMLMGIVFLPILLIFLQPDLGTSLVFMPIILFMMFVGGINVKYFLGIVIIGLLAVSIPIYLTFANTAENIDSVFVTILSDKRYLFIISFSFLFAAISLFLVNLTLRNLTISNIIFFCFIVFIGLMCALIIQNYILKDYQKDRLIAFINPDLDRWGRSYNVIQSQITIGSGGVLGKGFAKGTQGQLGFLPSRSTDFIFSVVGEELGFLGSATVVILYMLFLFRLIRFARTVKDYLGGLITVGIITMFSLQIFINIGMTVGIAPITGLPLPFISYGGSSLWTSLFAMGLIFNIELNKYIYAVDS